MTPEELAEIERLDRLATKGPFRVNRHDCDGGAINWQVQQDGGGGEVIANITDDEPKRAKHDAAFFVLARTLLPRLAADYRDAVALTEHIQADLEAMHRANARVEATIADLREELARARQVNEQAERVRDENERLVRDLATVREELQTLHDVLSGARAVTAAEGRAEK